MITIHWFWVVGIVIIAVLVVEAVPTVLRAIVFAFAPLHHQFPVAKSSVPIICHTEVTEVQIRKRAKALWMIRGSPIGDDWTDWFQAEKELNQ